MSGAILVTGAASGIGLACAHKMIVGDGPAVLVDLNAEALEAAASKLGGAGEKAVRVSGDLRDSAVVARVVDAVRDAGGLRALAHGAGLSGAASDAKAIIDVNVVATAKLVDALEPVLCEGSAGVLLASQAGHFVAGSATPAIDALLDDPTADDLHERLVAEAGGLAEAPSGAYGLSKRAVHRLVVSRALAWGARGGRLVSVSPGPIDTPMGRDEVEKNRDAIGVIFEKTAVGQRLGRADEIAAVVAFLCSSDASFVSGVDLLVDGGSTNQVLGWR